METGTLLSYEGKFNREQLALVPTPPGTDTHRPVPHVEVINALIETLGFRHIGIHREEYAVSKDGMKMFGLMELETTFTGCRFAIGIRNAHDKSMRLAMNSRQRSTAFTMGAKLRCIWSTLHRCYSEAHDLSGIHGLEISGTMKFPTANRTLLQREKLGVSERVSRIIKAETRDPESDPG